MVCINVKAAHSFFAAGAIQAFLRAVMADSLS